MKKRTLRRLKKTKIHRILDLDLTEGYSIILLGPRKVGKSTFLKQNFPNSFYIDLLNTRNYIKYLQTPYLLAEEIEAMEETNPTIVQNPIIIDEVQKVPLLLDEVQRFIEDKGHQFILCGSSARKLKKSGANMLGGRALKHEMHPLTYLEIENFDLLKIINFGKIPSHYTANNPTRIIQSYLDLYLKEEILLEGLVRNIQAFSGFLETLAFSNGSIINYTSIAREVGVDAKSIKEYYQILIDTLLGYKIYPYKNRKKRRDILTPPKFYFFDPGIVQHLRGITIEKEKGEYFGLALEHIVLTELIAFKSYKAKNFSITYWRTKSGLEVDFILGDAEVAIEVKGSHKVDTQEYKGLNEFKQSYKPNKCIVITNEDTERKSNDILFTPYKIFFQRLWSGGIIN